MTVFKGFGERLREARKQSNLSQEDLAKALDIDRSSISTWETEFAYPSVKTLHDIVNILNVSADYLLGISSASPTSGLSDHLYTKEVTSNPDELAQTVRELIERVKWLEDRLSE